MRAFLSVQTSENHRAILQEKPDASPAKGSRTWADTTGVTRGADP